MFWFGYYFGPECNPLMHTILERTFNTFFLFYISVNSCMLNFLLKEVSWWGEGIIWGQPMSFKSFWFIMYHLKSVNIQHKCFFGYGMSCWRRCFVACCWINFRQCSCQAVQIGENANANRGQLSIDISLKKYLVSMKTRRVSPVDNRPYAD